MAVHYPTNKQALKRTCVGAVCIRCVANVCPTQACGLRAMALCAYSALAAILIQAACTHMRAPSHTIDSSWACPAYTHTQDSEVYKRFSDIYSVFLSACAQAAAVYTVFGCQAADRHALRCRIASLYFPLAAPQRVVGIHVCIQYIHRVTYIQPPCDTVPFSVAATYVSITLCHVAGLPAVCSRTAATT